MRNAGISTEYPLKLVNVNKQLKQASSANSRIVLFVGGDEELNGQFKIKIMATGEEKLIAMASAAEEISAILEQN